MNLLTDADFRRALKAPDRLPAGYLFFGEEDYLKLRALEAAEGALAGDPALAAFNIFRLDALDYSPGALLDALIPLPMMQEKKLVVLTGMNFTAMRSTDADRLCALLETLGDYPHNLLILVVPCEGIDEGYLPRRPSALLGRLGGLLTPVRFGRVSPQKLAGWAIKHFAHGGVQASPETASFLLDYCGRDMFTLAGEIDKLCCYVLAHGRTEARPDDVREVACAGLEYDAFAFGNAVMEGRRADALAALAMLRTRRVDPLLLLGEVIRVWSDLFCVDTLRREGKNPDEIAAATKIHSYKVSLYLRQAQNIDSARISRALTLCTEADAALKLSPQGYAAIERLVCGV